MDSIFDPPDEKSLDRPPAQKIGLGVKYFSAIKLFEAWKKIAGPILLQKSEFEGLTTSDQGLALKIKIQDALWRNEFYYTRHDILKSYQEALRKMGLPEQQIPKVIMIHSGQPKRKSSKD